MKAKDDADLRDSDTLGPVEWSLVHHIRNKKDEIAQMGGGHAYDCSELEVSVTAGPHTLGPFAVDATQIVANFSNVGVDCVAALRTRAL